MSTVHHGIINQSGCGKLVQSRDNFDLVSTRIIMSRLLSTGLIVFALTISISRSQAFCADAAVPLQIVLTFDDGPDSINIEKVLDTLKLR
jgi:peptidoglycan/xylan/chitin deacetylase (PgdA/CDA1 family)